MTLPAEQRHPNFLGWRVVAGGFVALLVAGGIGMFSFSVFVIPFEETFGWSRTAVSGAAALWAVVFGFSGPLVGACVERYGARGTMLGGAAIAGLTYWLMALVSHLAAFYLLMAISGAGTAACTTVPVQTVVSHWFRRFRGRALGVALLGFGFGGLVTPPLANAIVVRFDWQTAFHVGAALMWLVVMPAIGWSIRTRPSDVGQFPDGLSLPDHESNLHHLHTGLTLRAAARTASFWQLFAIQSLFLFGSAALSLHFIAWADDQGIPSQRAANVLGLAVGMSIVSRILFGWLGDRWNPGRLLAATAASMAAAVALVILEGSHWGPTLGGFAVLYGLGMGGIGVLLPIVVGQCFGTRHFGRIMGAVLSGFAPGAILGPLAAGIVRDRSGSYEVALALCGAAFLLCALAALAIRFPYEDAACSRTVGYCALYPRATPGPDLHEKTTKAPR